MFFKQSIVVFSKGFLLIQNDSNFEQNQLSLEQLLEKLDRKKSTLIFFCNDGYRIIKTPSYLFSSVVFSQHSQSLKQQITSRLIKCPQVTTFESFIPLTNGFIYKLETNHIRKVKTSKLGFILESRAIHHSYSLINENVKLFNLNEEQVLKVLLKHLQSPLYFFKWALIWLQKKLNLITKFEWGFHGFSFLLLIFSIIVLKPTFGLLTPLPVLNHQAGKAQTDESRQFNFFLKALSGIKYSFSTSGSSIIKRVKLKPNQYTITGLWQPLQKLELQNLEWEKLIKRLKNQPFVARVQVKKFPLEGALNKDRPFTIVLILKR